jgi:hypothetical protein
MPAGKKNKYLRRFMDAVLALIVYIKEKAVFHSTTFPI